MKAIDSLIQLFRDTKVTTDKNLYCRIINQLATYKWHIKECSVSYTCLGSKETDKCIVLNLITHPEATFKKPISGEYQDIRISIDRLSKVHYKVIIEYIKPKKPLAKPKTRKAHIKSTEIFSLREINKFLQ